MLVHHTLRHSWRETHLVSWLHFVVKVSPPLKEPKYSVEKTLNALNLLGDCVKEVVNALRVFH